MAVYSGKDGKLLVGTTTLARVRNWSFNGTVDTLETTALSDKAREYTWGLKSATGSATIFYHDEAAGSVKTVLDPCITTGDPTQVTLELQWGSKKLKFNAWINSANLGMSTGEVMSAEISFTMTGNYNTVTL